MLGTIIKHSPSTNFYEADNEPPPSKKLKRIKSTETCNSNATSDDETIQLDSPRLLPLEIPDSEEEYNSDDEDHEQRNRPSHQTGLESALPPVKTDKEAIAEYEATRAAEINESLQRDNRLDQMTWVRGKSSIYVDAFNLALDTVLEDERHLFDEKEMRVFEIWNSLDYEAQYLYVRLFLRKTAAWHRLNRLKYHSDVADLKGAIEVLRLDRKLPLSSAAVQTNPGELEPPEGTALGESFTFADDSKQEIQTLEEASSLLTLEELKLIAKDAKVVGKTKKELLRSFRKTSQRQSGLEWRGLYRTVSADTDVSNEPECESPRELAREESPRRMNRDGLFLQKILESIGSCIRLSSATLKLFERVHSVFYRSTEWTEKSLTTIILAKISRRNFPEYIVSRSTNIFISRPELLEFEASIRTQFRVDSILEFNGNPTKDGLQQVLEIFEDVYPRWKVILEEEQRKELRVYESGEGAYLRRFSPAWVYTRLIHKGTMVLGKFKQHKREHRVLSELLAQNLFHAARRGAWYQRKALLEEHYMAALSPSENLSEESQKKHWKRVSLATCEEGLQDKDCHLIYHYDLQKRITKLEKNLKVVKREQHDFGHARLVKPVERTVQGQRVYREDTPKGQKINQMSSSRRGSKTIWIDEDEDGAECGVEAMCLSWYRKHGWKGYHSEGGIVRTLFAYLFYDVLFLYIPNVFQTQFQTCPLDLHTDAFYPSRASEINRRLVEIGNGSAAELIQKVDRQHREAATCVVGLDWSFELSDLLEIIECFNGEALATVCKVMAQEYRQRGGGIPDLFLWHSENKEVMFSEVKSENDRLSDTQRLWIHVLTGAGIKVELCNAVARESKT